MDHFSDGETDCVMKVAIRHIWNVAATEAYCAHKFHLSFYDVHTTFAHHRSHNPDNFPLIFYTNTTPEKYPNASLLYTCCQFMFHKKDSFGTIMALYAVWLEKLCRYFLKDHFLYHSLDFGSVCPKLMLHYILSKYGRIFYDREKPYLFFRIWAVLCNIPSLFAKKLIR